MPLKIVTPGIVPDNSLVTHLVSVDRVVKVVKGGRIFTFRAVVVVGNKSGVFGYGLGKARDVMSAKKKAFNTAKKSLRFVPVRSGGTIAHDVKGSCGATNVMLKPAKPGTGIIAGSATKLLLEVIGFTNIVAKIHGPNNPLAAALATIDALSNVYSVKLLASLRSKTVQEVISQAKPTIPTIATQASA
jgi:small subunit ribosomal protein S5